MSVMDFEFSTGENAIFPIKTIDKDPIVLPPITYRLYGNQRFIVFLSMWSTYCYSNFSIG